MVNCSGHNEGTIMLSRSNFLASRPTRLSCAGNSTVIGDEPITDVILGRPFCYYWLASAKTRCSRDGDM